METNTAPEFVAADTTPRTYVRPLPVRWTTGRATAETIAKYLGSEGEFWEAFDDAQNRTHIHRQRYVADARGALHIYAQDGHKVIIHPVGRRVRIAQPRTH